jgi:dolichyl-phosphate beta-glucosyltransferase
MDFSLILPIYNEEENMTLVAPLLIQEFPQTEIILVNDGSKDNTLAILQKYESKVGIVTYAQNMGKGYAIKRGVEEATGDIIVFCDADLPFGIKSIAEMINRLKTNPNLDIAIAEKIQPKEGFCYHCAKMAVKKIIALLTGLRFKDTQAGLKGFKKETAKKIFAKTFINRFAIDIEVLYLAKKLNNTVDTIELRVEDNYYNRPSKFTTKEGFYLLKDIFKIYFHHYDV